ncbi:carboxypeptidase-like regulatory domain-containing protein [Sphingobacterium sp. UDSM-2020]|uniref:carboxypeptidase-like regulatory domain-containing protein n=1 Tax=Sphingobacterium sp. UDSM-2020 TaxID=2795738 RepID=UPI001937AB7F|nr:carboxypeptidase-like regulatory domain-containing protein [Sphingobacterium sp. UDSM-2020]QQD15549.1 carboxypeptidase-like regulatory domain-containing protein [Sphingobacterium sp. UDSM-2020]
MIPNLASGNMLLPKVLVYTQSIVQHNISGKVVDAIGRCISGVTVREKGGKSSTSTDNNGSYTLAVSSLNPILVFSSIGYISQEIASTSAAMVTLKPYLFKFLK